MTHVKTFNILAKLVKNGDVQSVLSLIKTTNPIIDSYCWLFVGDHSECTCGKLCSLNDSLCDIAVKSSNLEMLKTLRDLKCKWDIKKIYTIAIEKNDTATVEYILQFYKSPELLNTAIICKKIDILKVLVEKIKLTKRMCELAIENNSSECFYYIVENGILPKCWNACLDANPDFGAEVLEYVHANNIKCKNNLLRQAVFRNNVKCTEVLLRMFRPSQDLYKYIATCDGYKILSLILAIKKIPSDAIELFEYHNATKCLECIYHVNR